MLDQIICWMDTHAGVASWVQAIGTIVALMIAVGVPLWLHYKETRIVRIERRLKTQGVAILIRPALQALKGIVLLEIQRMEDSQFDTSSIIEVPEAILSQTDNLWMLATLGGHVLQVISSLQGAEALIFQQIKSAINNLPNNPERVGQQKDARIGALSAILKDVEAAIEQIQIILKV